MTLLPRFHPPSTRVKTAPSRQTRRSRLLILQAPSDPVCRTDRACCGPAGERATLALQQRRRRPTPVFRQADAARSSRYHHRSRRYARLGYLRHRFFSASCVPPFSTSDEITPANLIILPLSHTRECP